jgi:hypothetical protein
MKLPRMAARNPEVNMGETVQDPNKEHFLNPRPSVGHYKLPCGWIDADGKVHRDIVVREMTGVEEELLAGRGDILPRMNKVMANCLQQIGPHKCDGDVRIVNQMTVVDRMVLLIALRRASLGDDYTVEGTCPACSAKDRYTLDLSRLKTTETDDGALRTITTTTKAGNSLTFHVMTGEDEAWLARARDKLKGEGMVTLNMLCRIDEFAGHKIERDVTKRREFMQSVALIANLGVRERAFIRKQIQEAEGEIDLKLEVTCKACGNEWGSNLNVADPGFFFPSEM